MAQASARVRISCWTLLNPPETKQRISCLPCEVHTGTELKHCPRAPLSTWQVIEHTSLSLKVGSALGVTVLMTTVVHLRWNIKRMSDINRIMVAKTMFPFLTAKSSHTKIRTSLMSQNYVTDF